MDSQGEKNVAASSSSAPAAPSATELKALGDAWIAGTVTSAQAISDPRHPFYVNSCHSTETGFKYKYPEAWPTPEGEDDVVWNKTYTAADSRMYNKHGKDANNSKKFRHTKETYELALEVHLGNKKKHAEKNGGDPFAYKPAAYKAEATALSSKVTPKPKSSVSTSHELASSASSSDLRDTTAGLDLTPMSISEKIKSEGRNRKPSSVAALSAQQSPGSSSAFTTHNPLSEMSNPAPKMGSPAPPKVEKVAVKKKGTAAAVKKSAPKKAKPAAGKSNVSARTQQPAIKPPSASDSESNDGEEYCICRGPDDHRMMVWCDGGCDDWYHCSCLNVDEADATELLDKFICPKCKTDKLFTTWKPMCRFVNVDKTHRKAADIKNKSKYCSQECGKNFMKLMLSKMRIGDDNDPPTAGGEISQKQLFAMLSSVNSIEEFHALGKKPKLPAKEGADPNRPAGLDYLLPEEQAELDEMKRKKKMAEEHIVQLDKQIRLLCLINDRTKLAAKHLRVETADICGYDDRIMLMGEEFELWLASGEGKKAFDTRKLGPRTAETLHIGRPLPFPGQQVLPPNPVDELNNLCLLKRKKCAHLHWREIHNQDFHNMQDQERNEIKKIDEKTKEIIDDAETREATKAYDEENITIRLF